MRHIFARAGIVLAIAAVPALSAFAQHRPSSSQRPSLVVVDPTRGAEEQSGSDVTELTLGMTQLLAPAPAFHAITADTNSKLMTGLTVADVESYHFLVAGFDASGNFTASCVQGQTEAAQAETAAAGPTIMRLRVHRPVVTLETE